MPTITAVVVGVAGALTNADSAHTLTEDFSVFGFDRADPARRGLTESRRVPAVALQERDEMHDQRDAAPAPRDRPSR